MIDFETAIKIGEEVFASLDRLYQLLDPQAPASAGPATALEAGVPSLLEFRRRLLAVHAKRHLVTELAASGKLGTSEAQSLVDAGASASAGPTAGAPFANVLAWLQANGPTIAQDIAAAIPIIVSLLALFGG